jgi:hypothetical protein
MSDAQFAPVTRVSPPVVGYLPSDAKSKFEFTCPRCRNAVSFEVSAFNDNISGVSVVCTAEGHCYDCVRGNSGVGGVPGA